MTAAFFPSQFGGIEVRFGATRPAHSVYLRRRLLVGLVLTAVVAILGLGVHSVLADRGGVPASVPTIRSGNVVLTPAALSGASGIAAPAAPIRSTAISYIVQPGDSLWNLAQRFHGAHGLSSYLESLISTNGGSVVQPGQVLLLP